MGLGGNENGNEMRMKELRKSVHGWFHWQRKAEREGEREREKRLNINHKEMTGCTFGI